jgi:tRNA A37 threonylcarbamoyladenosine dehydratase
MDETTERTCAREDEAAGAGDAAGARDAAAPEAPFKLHRRWDRAARLFGEDGMARLARAHVVVLGLGGVGSFAAEGLARSGVGRLTLVDFDAVCATNVNRQLHALRGTFGKGKAELMAERCRLVNPDARVDGVRAFYQAQTSEQLLAGPPDYVVDAIDNVTAKLHLIVTCRERGIPLVSSMGAAGKLDPTRVRLADLSQTRTDPFARDIRRLLRRKHGVDTDRPTGILCVYSPEPRVGPFPPAYDAGQGFLCICPGRDNEVHTCDRRAVIDGTAGFVTSVFGMVAASAVVRALVGGVRVTRGVGE